MKAINWDDVQEKEEGQFARPGAGGYVMRIVDVKDNPEREYTEVYYDIAWAHDDANKEFVGFYDKRFNSSGGQYYYPCMRRSYKPTAVGFYKGFLRVLEKSNPGKFSMKNWNNNENAFNGLFFGAVLGDEEYINQQGALRLRQNVSKVIEIAKIKAGDFKVPELKKLEQGAQPVTYSQTAAASPAPTPVPFDDELPF